MSKSNWKGSAAWQAVPDPTNILENTCLQLIPERNGVAEDYILQKIGTSTGLTYLNIGIKFNYAWPTNAQNSTDAEFGAIVRADNFTTGTTYCSMAENAYIGKLNKSDGTVYLCKRHNNSLLTIMTESISSGVLSGTKNTFEMKSFGTETPIIQIIINNSIVLSYSDDTPTPLNSGYVGLYSSSGETYITSLVLLEYDEDGR